ncbi:MAG: YobA family protein, partial [Actinomycetota bacterium]|nr:YobA family protein [Actinomycetota bacterium]
LQAAWNSDDIDRLNPVRRGRNVLPTLVRSVLVVLAMLAASCGGIRERPAAAPPPREPDIVGVITGVQPAVVRTENCVDRRGHPPHEPVSSTDPPSCTAPTAETFGHVLVEAEPAADWGDDKASVSLPRDTLLLAESKGGYTEIDFNSLRVGELARVWFEGPVAESYPAQATAAALVIAKEA